MSHVEIRQTIPTDLDALADVLVQVHASDGYPVEGVGDAQAWVTLPERLGQWTALLDGDPAGHVALLRPALEDGAPAILVEQGVPADRVAVLARLFVSPNARGKGVANALMAAAEGHACRMQLGLVLDVLNKDRGALQLYEARGWRRLGRIVHRFGENSREGGLALIAPACPVDFSEREQGYSR